MLNAVGRTVRLNGERCRAQRQKRGRSRESLAERCNGRDALPVATIKRAENGQAIYANSAGSLARLLGTTVHALLADASERSGAVPGGALETRPAIAVLSLAAPNGDARLAVLA